MSGPDLKNRSTGGANSKPKNNLKQNRGRTSNVEGSREAATDDELEWQEFANHPWGVAICMIVVPYVVYTAFYLLTLRYPEWIAKGTSGLVSMRPAVRLEDVRQLLVVGPMGSGTQFVAALLREVLQLEIEHEASDAETYFTRDGTLSNFLAIRYLRQANESEFEHQLQTVSKQVCTERRDLAMSSDRSAFHPKYYRRSKCSSLQSWSSCWKDECESLLREEWGCAFTPSGCKTQYQYILHIVRHPMRTVEFLMDNFCPNNAILPSPVFLQFASPFLDDTPRSCLETIAWYVIRVHQSLIAAKEAGSINGLVQYENTALCDLIQKGGFTDPHLVVFEPNCKRLALICEKSSSKDTVKLPFAKLSSTDELQASTNITLNVLSTSGSDELARTMHDLCNELGYNPMDGTTEASNHRHRDALYTTQSEVLEPTDL